MAAPVAIENIKVLAEGRPRGTGRLVCEVKGKVLTFHPGHILPESTIAKVGDVGTLVVPQWVAVSLGLA